MSASLIMFCCPSVLLTTIGSYRSPKECTLWTFAVLMSNSISSPLNTPLSSTSSSLSITSPIPENFLPAILNKSPFVIQLEKWVEGEVEDMRLFIPHPAREYTFLEMERGMVKRGGWEWGWDHIKLRCEHRWTMFVVKMLERVDWNEEERMRCRVFGGNWREELEVENESENEVCSLDEDEREEAMTEASFQGLDSRDENVELDGADENDSGNSGDESED